MIHASKAVHKQEDLHGRKIRFPTRLAGEALKALGAGAVGMPVPQVPESLAQGVIDGAVVPWEVVPALEAPGAGGPPYRVPGHAHLLHLDPHAGDEQGPLRGPAGRAAQVIDNASGLAGSELAGAAWDKAGAAARQKAQERGNEVFVLPEDEAPAGAQATQPVTDAWVAAPAPTVPRCSMPPRR